MLVESAHHGDGKCRSLCFPRSNRARRLPGPSHSILLTFEKDKMSILTLVGSTDVPWQSAPEVANWHGVVVQNSVVPDSPEPAALWKRVGIDRQHVQGTLAQGGSCASLLCSPRSGMICQTGLQDPEEPGSTWRAKAAPSRELWAEAHEPDYCVTLDKCFGSGKYPEAGSKEGAGQGSEQT